MKSDYSRFMKKVEITPTCWLWLGGKDHKGYGKFSIGSSRNEDGSRRNSMVSAHRFSYEFSYGAIPDDGTYHGVCVLHKCDMPSCVNPDHLFLGTNAENVRDMDAKNRRVTVAKRGSDHANSILNESQVREIVRLHRVEKVTQLQLSKDFGVCHATINHIFMGRLWGHLGLSNKGVNA
jgi:hypothetical protein